MNKERGEVYESENQTWVQQSCFTERRLGRHVNQLMIYR